MPFSGWLPHSLSYSVVYSQKAVENLGCGSCFHSILPHVHWCFYNSIATRICFLFINQCFSNSLLTITLRPITVFFVGLYPIRVHPGTILSVCRCTEPFANHSALPVTGTPVCPAAPSTVRSCLKYIKSQKL